MDTSVGLPIACMTGLIGLYTVFYACVGLKPIPQGFNSKTHHVKFTSV